VLREWQEHIQTQRTAWNSSSGQAWGNVIIKPNNGSSNIIY
jgi:hypothetical protein